MTDNDAYWLPIIFMFLMGFSLLMYAILDGYDLGIGILLPADNAEHRDNMIASIGPFWDANETWLVLAVGLLLIAFPSAYNTIFQALYLPVTLMLCGLILRGVAFDFRVKGAAEHKVRWDLAFKFGSLLATWSQGYMLGSYIVGFDDSNLATAFCFLSAVCVSAAYCFIGASWLILKSEDELQLRAVKWARWSLWITAFGIFSVSIVNPLVSNEIREKWFTLPALILLFPIPLLSGLALLTADRYLANFSNASEHNNFIPFACAVITYFLCFQGLAYSFFPYVVQGDVTIWQAASAPESLRFILYGAIIVLPAILGYTIFSYRVFWGKSTALHYG